LGFYGSEICINLEVINGLF